MNTGFMTFELRRVARSRKFWIVALLFPTLLYIAQAGIMGSDLVPGTAVPYSAYLVGSLAAFGALFASLNVVGARVAVERTTGWQRQLRLTPLSPVTYLIAKVSVAMIVCLPTLLTVAAVGALVEGVELAPGRWVAMVLGVWLGTMPFALLGLLIGQLATAESVQVVVTCAHMLLGFIGGALLPSPSFPGWLEALSRLMPSHWLAALGHAPVLGESQRTAALILVGWTLALGVAVVARYRADSNRV